MLGLSWTFNVLLLQLRARSAGKTTANDASGTAAAVNILQDSSYRIITSGQRQPNCPTARRHVYSFSQILACQRFTRGIARAALLFPSATFADGGGAPSPCRQTICPALAACGNFAAPVWFH